MSKLTKKSAFALKQKLSKIGFSLTGSRTAVLEAGGEELGYTSGGGTVYVAFTHPYYESLSVLETISFITGTFVHEVMHLLQTDMLLYNKAIRDVPTQEREFIQTIYNIIEDSAIEYFAPLYVSDHLMHSLDFMRASIQAQSLPLQEYEDAFVQFIGACIQYGDAGLLRGDFTYPEAKKCFLSCLPIMNDAVEEPDNEKRAAYAKEVFELSRPLWQEKANEAKAWQELLDMLREAMKTAGKSSEAASGGGPLGSPLSPVKEGEKPEESERTRRRKITFKRVSAEEYKRLAEEAAAEGSPPGPEDDITILIPDEPVEEKPTGTGGAMSPLQPEAPSDEELREAEKGLEKEGVVSAEDAERISREMKSLENDIAAADAAESEGKSTLLDIPLSADGYKMACKGVTCKNIRATIDFSAEVKLMDSYHAIVEPMQPTINKLTRQLQRIFQNSPDEKDYRAAGKVCVPRLASGARTSRVFTKTKTQTKNDLHICIAIDNSGSMHGNSIAQARTSAIVLAEVFSRLNIPTSMFGFTADHAGVSVYHEHYLTGQNTARDRLRLLGIRALSNNFDGYSIRYAAQLLEKKPAAHKLLFVISDGSPACQAYGRVNGVQDTKLAIKEASKTATVVGILVGHASPDVHREMYGYNFLHIKDPSQLAVGLVKCVSNKIKEW